MARLQPFFIKSHSKPRVDNRRVLGDRNYDADWFRVALEAKGIQPCIPGRGSRNKPIRYDKCRYRRRSRIEIMFGRPKDWRSVATRYGRCSTVALEATVIFWL